MQYNKETLLEQASKYYYYWIGQNATTGTPHPQTGKMSMYGQFVKFKTKQDRDIYFNQWRSNNPSERIYKCSVHTGRKYSLGKSWLVYLEELLLYTYPLKAGLDF